MAPPAPRPMNQMIDGKRKANDVADSYRPHFLAYRYNRAARRFCRVYHDALWFTLEQTPEWAGFARWIARRGTYSTVRTVCKMNVRGMNLPGSGSRTWASPPSPRLTSREGFSCGPPEAANAALPEISCQGCHVVFSFPRRGEEDGNLNPHPKISADRSGNDVWFFRFLLRSSAPPREKR